MKQVYLLNNKDSDNMKTRILITILFVCIASSPLHSQTYSSTDSLALLTIDAGCDAFNQLNWNTESNPGNWTGVSWNDSIPKRVKWLEVGNKSLTGNMNVSSLGDMSELWCNSNQLTGLNLTGLTNLKRVVCRSNQLTSLDISSLLKLRELYCNNNQLDNLDASSAVEMTYLTCNDNQLVSLNLSNLTNLKELVCSNNQLATLIVSDKPGLTSLDCSVNQLTTLTVTNDSDLVILNCAYNQLANLDLSGITNLTLLICNFNQLPSLDVTNLTDLTSMYCHGNQLTSLDLTNLANLTSLYCDENQLTSLDVSSLTKLKVLSCNSNLLTRLDVTVCPDLTTLDCSFNKIKNLDITGLSQLSTLSVNDNELTGIDVSSLTSLSGLWCSENKLPFSSLATALNVANLFCGTMDTIFTSVNLAGAYPVDYSGEALIADSVTTFVFYKDGVPVDTNITGLYTTNGSGVFYCQMVNGHFPGLILTTAKITVSGETPVVSVSNSTIDLNSAANSSGNFIITSNTAWIISGLETWLTANRLSGLFNDTITVIATANPDTSTRSAIITISATGVTPQTVTVTQEGTLYLMVSASELSVEAAANSTATFNITSNTAWTVESTQAWLTVDQVSGSNSVTITLTAEANPDYTTRSAVVTVSADDVTSQTVNVTQDGKAPLAISLPAAMGVMTYPCPAVDFIIVRLEQEILPSVISLFTIDGIQLMQLETGNDLTEIDMTKYSSGIYVLRVMTSGIIIEKKILKY
jgi:Leucine-rich repeat (LRR) protein